MFGIMFFLFMGICGILAACRMAVMDMQMYNIQRQDPDDDFEDYWMSASGRMISRKTHRPCMKSNTLGVKGHDCLIDCKTLAVIKDYTEEKNQRVKEMVMASEDDNITAYKVIPCYKKFPSKIVGPRYVDKKTGDVYVVRQFGVRKEGLDLIVGCNFYMSLKNGYLIRLTDDDMVRRDYTDDDMFYIQKFIKEFNALQDKDIENKGISGFDEHYYHNKANSHDYLLEKIYDQENIHPKEIKWSH